MPTSKPCLRSFQSTPAGNVLQRHCLAWPSARWSSGSPHSDWQGPYNQRKIFPVWLMCPLDPAWCIYLRTPIRHQSRLVLSPFSHDYLPWRYWHALHCVCCPLPGWNRSVSFFPTRFAKYQQAAIPISALFCTVWCGPWIESAWNCLAQASPHPKPENILQVKFS